MRWSSPRGRSPRTHRAALYAVLVALLPCTSPPLAPSRRPAGVGLVSAEPFEELNLRPDLEHAPFLHGVASADPLPDSVLLWTRVTPDDSAAGGTGGGGGTATRVRWAVWEKVGDGDGEFDGTERTQSQSQSSFGSCDDAFECAPHSGIASTGPDLDYTVTVDVDGLEPGTAYRYQFELIVGPGGGAPGAAGPGARRRRSAVGTTRTVSPTSRTATIAFLSCTSLYSGYFNSYRHLASLPDVDAVLHLGDFTYPDVDPDEVYRVPRGLCPDWDWFAPSAVNQEAGGSSPDDNADPYLVQFVRSLNCENSTDLDRYRWISALYMLDPDLRAARASHPFVVALDNHDLNGHVRSPKDGSRRAALEWIPQRVNIVQDAETGEEFVDSTRRFRFGTDLLDLIVLDTYSYSGDDARKARVGLLGDGQRRWLDGVLDESSRDGVRWRMFGSGKTFMPFVLNHAASAVWLPMSVVLCVIALLLASCVATEVALFGGYEEVRGDEGGDEKGDEERTTTSRFFSRRRRGGVVEVDGSDYAGGGTRRRPVAALRSAHARSPAWMRCFTVCGWVLLASWPLLWIGTWSFLDGRLNPPGGGPTYLNPAPDTWEGQTGSMMRLFDMLEGSDTDRNNVWLTGDMHYSVAADVFRFDPATAEDLLSYDPDADPAAVRRYGVEMLAASGTRGNLDEKLGEVTRGWLRPGSGILSALVNYFANKVIAAMNPHFRYFQGQEHGYGVVKVTETHVEASWLQFPILRLTDDVKVGRTLVAYDMDNKWTEKI